MNNVYSKFMKTITGTFGPILFNPSLNELFFSIATASIYIFPDGNSLSAWAQNVSDLIAILESESHVAVGWFNKNKMIVFETIVLDEINLTRVGNH